jgi:hypothetical protein
MEKLSFFRIVCKNKDQVIKGRKVELNGKGNLQTPFIHGENR